MRLFTISSLLILIFALSACKKSEPELASSSAFASAEPPPLVIAKESRDQLQKSKEAADNLEKANVEKQKAIEDVSGEKN